MELWSNVEKEKAAKQERAAARQPADKGAAAAKPTVSRGDEQHLLLHAAGGSDIPIHLHSPSSRATDSGEEKLPAHSSSPVESPALKGQGREEEAEGRGQQSAAGSVGGGPLLTGGPDNDKEQDVDGPATTGTATTPLNHNVPGLAQEGGATGVSGTALPAVAALLRKTPPRASFYGNRHYCIRLNELSAAKQPRCWLMWPIC